MRVRDNEFMLIINQDRGDAALALRTLVMANNMLARLGLAAMLSAWDDVQVIAQASLSETLADDLAGWQPDAAVLEFSAGWDRRHFDALEGLPSIALLADADDGPAAMSALQNCGAYGLLLNDTDADSIYHALLAVHSGLIVIDPLIAPALLNAGLSTDDAPTDALTPREHEVLQLMAEGLPNKTIAARLNISANTVKFHINAILSKLDAQSRTEAVVRATRLGLIIL